MVKHFLDAPGQCFVAGTERSRIVTHERGHLLQAGIHLQKGAVIHQVHRCRVIHIHSLRGCPVSQVPAAVFFIGPGLQKPVHRIGIHVIQPMNHGWVETFQGPSVPIIHISAPGRLHQEAAPVRAAARRVGIGRGVGQAAVRALGIGPGLQPVQVQGGREGHGLQRLGRCIAVPAISQPLNAGAVHHITSKSKVAGRCFHQPIDSIQLRIRALERALPGNVVAYSQGFQFLCLGSLGKAFQEHVTHQMMVKTVLETVFLTGSDVNVPAHGSFFQVAIRITEIAESSNHLRSGGKCRQRRVHHGVHNAAVIYQIASFTQIFNRDRQQGFQHADGLTHLLAFHYAVHLHHIHLAPLGLKTGPDFLSAKAVGCPGTQVPAAAPGSFPGGIGKHLGLSEKVQFGLYQRAVIYSAKGGGLIPAGAGGNDQFVNTFLQGDLISDNQGPPVQLRNRRLQRSE